MATALSFTEEKNNCFRLLSLIIDGGTLVLRQLFDLEIPPNDLQNKLNDTTIRGKLNNLRQRKVITTDQWNVLFPNIGQPTSENFDISLLTCLLRYICGQNENAPAWTGIPSSGDHSKEADINKLKIFRNEVCHLKQVGINQRDFLYKWSEVEQVILRLGNGNVQLSENIQKLKQDNIDHAAESAIEHKVEEWKKKEDALKLKIEELDENVTDIKAKVDINAQQLVETEHNVKSLSITSKHYGNRLDHLETKSENIQQNMLTHGLEHAKLLKRLNDHDTFAKQLQKSYAENTRNDILRHCREMASLCIEEVERDDIFVKTKAFDEAKERLQRTGCLILTGQPGEGKTTMATKLMSELAGAGKCLMYSEPDQWLFAKFKPDFEIMFIDDIFGGGVLDENLLRGWSKILCDIERAVRLGKIRVIITTRHYILEEAKSNLRNLYLFQDENIQVLQSSQLSISERNDILIAHLKQQKRPFNNLPLEEICNSISTYNPSVDLTEETHEPQAYVGKQCNNSMIGFPEIAKLFSSNEDFYGKGPVFFHEPLAYFKSCMEDLFVASDSFLPLLLIWCNPNKELQIKKLEPQSNSRTMNEISRQFGIEDGMKMKSKCKRTLESHKHGFITYISKTGTYKFCHRIVSDMVGLVAGKEYPEAILRLASEDFLLQYFTTDKQQKDEFHIFLDEFRFKTLSQVIYTRLLDKSRVLERSYSLFHVINERIAVKQTNYRDLNMTLGNATVNDVILRHDCFENERFVQVFISKFCDDDIFRKPVLTVSGQFGYYGIDFRMRSFPIYLPSLSLLSGYRTLFEKSKVLYPRVYSQIESQYINLLIATHMGMKDVCEMLLETSNIPTKEAIYIAAENQNIEVLDFLLKHPASVNPNFPNFTYSNCEFAARGNTKKHDIFRVERHIRVHLKSLLHLKSYIINENSPLIVSARKGLLLSMQCLLANGADVNYRNSNGMSALDKAVLFVDPEACKLLLQYGAEVNHKVPKFKRTPLHMNADVGGKNSELITKHLLQYGAKISEKDYRGHLPIHCAAIRGNTNIVEVLLQEDISQMNRILISYGTKSKLKGMDLVHVAVWKRNIELVDMLINYGCSTNHRDVYGRTPFYCAVADSDDTNFELIGRLIPHSDVKQADKDGFTPLHVAILNGKTNTAKLICSISDVNAQDKYGKTPLHTACEQQNSEMFRTLVEDYKADLRILTKTGKSVLNILLTTLVRPILSNFISQKKLKTMSPEGIKAGTLYVEEIPVWEEIVDTIRNKDPEFVKLWIDIYTREISSKV